MAEPGSTESPHISKGPTADTIRHLRHQIEERQPQAEKLAKKSGITPTNRLVNTIAAELLRKDTDAGTDPLTQILNLKGYQTRQNEELVRARRSNKPMTVVVADANGLKGINDTKGHDAGDELLKKIARILQEASRASDVVARVGGDEYRVLLPESDSEQSQIWLERVKKALSENNVSLSIGMAQVDLANPDASIKQADERMYQAKQAHKKTQTSAK